MEILPVGVREFRAGLGADIIDAAVIISSQKGAGHLLQHIIIVLIDAEILLDELLGLHPKMFGDPFDILVGEQRAGGLTAIGTFKAVSSAEFLIMQFLHFPIQIPGWLLFKFLEKLFMFLMFIFGPLREPIDFLLHAAKI